MEPVSVVIPTYNRAKYLPRAVESVVQQKNFEGEILIVDDGSEDETASLVKLLSNHHPIRYYYINNSGPSAARNKGVAMSKYPYIAFLDSDDHWVSGKLAKQMKFLLDNREFSICHTGEKWLRKGIHLNQKDIHKPRHGYIFNHCLQLCGVGMSTVVMEKALFMQLGGFDTSMPCCEDYDFWLRLSSSHNFLLLKEPLTIKEGGRPDQLSYIYRVGMDKYRIYSIEKLLKEFDLSREQREFALNELEKKCEVYGKGCIKHGRDEEGWQYLALPQKYKKMLI